MVVWGVVGSVVSSVLVDQHTYDIVKLVASPAPMPSVEALGR